MKENIIIIDYLEKIHKANRPTDFKKLLSVQIKMANQDKEIRILRDMVEQSNKRNIRMEAKVRESERERLSLQSSVDVLKQQNEALREEINQLTKNIEL